MSVLSGISVDGVFSVSSNAVAQRGQLANSSLARGAKLMRDGQYEEAIAEFQRASGYQPGSSLAHRYIGRAYARLGNAEQAVKAYQRGVAVEQDSIEARTNLAHAYQQYGRLAEAEKEYRSLQSRDPGSVSVAASLGYLYLGQQRYSEAEGQFQRLARLAPGDPGSYRALGQLRNEQGQHSEALGYLKRALSIAPSDPASLAEMGSAYVGLGDTDRADTIVADLYRIGSDPANAYAYQLQLEMFTPQIAFLDPGSSTFRSSLGPNTALSTLDPALAEPGATRRLEIVFSFNQAMDAASVQNIFNWNIGRASGGEAGYYNYGVTQNPGREVALKPLPFAVRYDPITKKAHVYFDITQNAAGDGLMDPSHWVFRFGGTDASGNPMDPRGDQYSGSVGGPF